MKQLLRRHRWVALLVFTVGMLLIALWLTSTDEVSYSPAAVNAPEASDRTSRTLTPADLTFAEPAQTSVALDGNVVAFNGRVIDAATRQPVRKFCLQLHAPVAADGKPRAPAKIFRNSDGRFEWRNAPAGNWSLTVVAAGYQVFEIPDLVLESGETTDELVLPLHVGYRLAGRIYDERSRAVVHDAFISIREMPTGQSGGSGRTLAQTSPRSDGTFAVDSLPHGRLAVTVGARSYARREIETILDGQSPPLEIGLSSGALIEGYLAAPDGATPIEGEVGLFSPDARIRLSLLTQGAGEFSFQHLAPGRYSLTAQAEDGRAARDIVITGNEQLVGLVLALHAGHVVQGVITGLRPEHLHRVQVWVQREGDPASRHDPVSVDARGAYRVTGVQAGRVEVVAEVGESRQITKQAEMPADADLTINLRFREPQ